MLGQCVETFLESGAIGHRVPHVGPHAGIAGAVERPGCALHWLRSLEGSDNGKSYSLRIGKWLELDMIYQRQYLTSCLASCIFDAVIKEYFDLSSSSLNRRIKGSSSSISSR